MTCSAKSKIKFRALDKIRLESKVQEQVLQLMRVASSPTGKLYKVTARKQVNNYRNHKNTTTLIKIAAR